MITFLGKTVQNFFTSLKYILKGNMRFEHVISQAASISYDSLPISLIISVITAAVITIQVSKQFLMSGAYTYVGGTLAVVIIREIAPAFVALSIGARAGTAISAEIAVPARAPIARATNPGAISLIITTAIVPPMYASAPLIKNSFETWIAITAAEINAITNEIGSES